MNSIYSSFLIIIITTFSLAGCTKTNQQYSSPYNEEVKVNIDGNLNKDEWVKSQEFDFSFPWQEKTPPATEFYTVSDAEFLYFAFLVEDDDIVIVNSEEEIDVARGDRVEIFMAKKDDLENYYCFEMGPTGKLLDYQASYYRQFDYSWDIPSITLIGTINEGGYSVEGKIPLDILEDLGIYNKKSNDTCFLMGIYRGEFSHTDTDKPKEEWISWIKPDTQAPDFHVPSSFSNFCIGTE